MMDPILKRQLESREYIEPEKLLSLVRNSAGNYTEQFQAGLVAYMVQKMGAGVARVRVSFGEIQDADAVLRLDNERIKLAGATPAFKLVQLKEFHPRYCLSFQEFLD